MTLSLVENPDGSVSAQLPNPAVTEEVLKRILQWKTSGLSDDDIIKNLRKETVPPGHIIHTWTPGTFCEFACSTCACACKGHTTETLICIVQPICNCTRLVMCFAHTLFQERKNQNQLC